LGILQRYLWREMAGSFLAVTGVLLAILLVYQGGAVLARAAELQYPSSVVMRLFALGALQNITLLLPFGLLLAVVLAMGRLYGDNELFAAQACGLDFWHCQQAVVLVALPVVLLAGLITLQLAPRAAAAETTLRAAALRSALSVPIQPGHFRSLSGGRTVVYARAVAADGELQDVFIKRGIGDTVEATVARRARMNMAADGLSQTITLQDGERLEGTPGSASWRIVRFGQQNIPLVLPAAKPDYHRRSELATDHLVGSANPAERTELQTRLSWPLMTLVLALLALPLGRLRPRQSRFARVWLAVLLFALYANLLQVAGLWLERGTTPAWLGLWWVHGVVALVAWAALRVPHWLGRV
jgi:lipopolysaccharide export system permease protein